MSRSASVYLDWVDGTHHFRLGYGEMEELQERIDMGPYAILESLMNKTWRFQAIAQVIRLGLIGGGMTPGDALALTRRYVEARVPMENLFIAQAIMGAGVLGAPDEDASKKNEPAQPPSSTISPTERSASPASTAPGQPSA